MSELGRCAYEAYAEERAWKTFSGSDMLTWDTVGQDIQAGWDAAAEAAVALALGECSNGQGDERMHDERVSQFHD